MFQTVQIHILVLEEGKVSFLVLDKENLLFRGQKLSEKSYSITFPRAKIVDKVKEAAAAATVAQGYRTRLQSGSLCVRTAVSLNFIHFKIKTLIIYIALIICLL